MRGSRVSRWQQQHKKHVRLVFTPKENHAEIRKFLCESITNRMRRSRVSRWHFDDDPPLRPPPPPYRKLLGKLKNGFCYLHFRNPEIILRRTRINTSWRHRKVILRFLPQNLQRDVKLICCCDSPRFCPLKSYANAPELIRWHTRRFDTPPPS